MERETEIRKLTATQAAALTKILDRGGWVRIHSGRAAKDVVQKAMARRLVNAGLLRIVRGNIDQGRSGVNAEVTAAGCVALHEYRAAKLAKE